LFFASWYSASSSSPNRTPALYFAMGLFFW
jgi:hypothetical protein